ncbi:MAG: hypothetical protein JST20_02155 [Bacteroidetes bacterium]|nr:hypothetical protein [Bacteroidota bacterium]
MKNIVLMDTDEPSDQELETLMNEVAQVAKVEAILSNKLLAEKVIQEIRIAQEKQQSKSV